MVVDDEEDARDLLFAVLSARGAIVKTVSSVALAMEELPRLRPDVIISDIGMPYEDGYSLIRRIRALPPEQGGETPAIALTAYARQEDRRHALHIGFNAYLPKPVEPHELEIALLHWCLFARGVTGSLKSLGQQEKRGMGIL